MNCSLGPAQASDAACAHLVKERRRCYLRRLMSRLRSPLSAVGQLLRAHDRDRFLTTLFAPADRRDELQALYAFNYEIAKTREVVSEPMLGRMRLQWWRDSIAAIYEGKAARQHQVAAPLAAAIRARGLSQAHFAALIDGREQDLDDAPPATLPALEAYAAATSGGLVLLALEILDQRDERVREAGSEIGIAYALAGLLRVMPVHARARRCYLPGELAAAAGLDLERSVFALRGTPALARVVGEIAAAAARHLAAARRLRPSVGRRALPALLPAVIARRRLAALRRVGFDPFDPRLAAPEAGLPWRLALAAALRRY
jgi:NADH dehydrogenase [ubiquinone] 1 alpha subcomplex assembly factor 6